MQKIGCKTEPPCLSDLKDALRKKEVYGLLSACTVLPIVLVDKKEAQDLEELLSQDDSQFNNKAYENPLYKKAMIRRLPLWEAMGLLD